MAPASRHRQGLHVIVLVDVLVIAAVIVLVDVLVHVLVHVDVAGPRIADVKLTD